MVQFVGSVPLNTEALLYDLTYYAGSGATIERTSTAWRITTTGSSGYAGSTRTFVVTGTGLPTGGSANFPDTGTITAITGLDLLGTTTFRLTGLSLPAATLGTEIATNDQAGYRDLLFGGADQLTSLAAGSTTLAGGSGADTIRPGASSGYVYAGEGDDLVLVTSTAAYLYGQNGLDTVSAGLASGDWTINLGSGTYGRAGEAVSYLYEFENATGGAGNDLLIGNAGANLLAGGTGNDTLAGGLGDDTLRGEGGNDTASFHGASAAVTATLTAGGGGTATGGVTGTDTFVGIENLIGGSGDDTLTGNADANVLEGGAGNDSLVGGAGLDTASYAGNSSGVVVRLSVAGGQYTGSSTGTDTLVGIENLLGGSGADTLGGSTGANRLTGGAGDDLLEMDAGNDTLDGGLGRDRVDLSTATANLAINLSLATGQSLGALGVDTFLSIESLSTGSGNDSLVGNEAANTLSAGGGDDTVEGGVGNDTLDGGIGTDTLSFAGASRGIRADLTSFSQATGIGTYYVSNFENLLGGAFADALGGSSTANRLTGGAGNDTLNGGSGDDTLDGGLDLDTASFAGTYNNITASLAIPGGQATGLGTDTFISIENLTGGFGNDSLTGNSGANVLEGGSGNDTLDGGGGLDTASYAGATAGVTVSLSGSGPKVTGGAGTDTLIQIENLIGGSGNDSLTGSAAANVIEGGLGDDTLAGGSGTDTLSYAGSALGVTVSLATTGDQDTGGAGVDRVSAFENLAGGAGDDDLTGTALANRLSGGAGDDTLDGGNGNDTLDGGTGTDTADYSALATPVTVDLSLATGQVTGAAGTDTLASIEVLRLGGGADTVTGGTAAVTVLAGAGNDSLTGGTAGDDLRGEAGNDALAGLGGADTLAGGAGDDTLDGGADADTADYSGDGPVAVDLLVTAAQDTGGAGVDRLIAIENLVGSGGADTLEGSNGANDLRGGAGGDLLDGRRGDDLLVGGQGDDTLVAGIGDDTLVGGGNDDVYGVVGTGRVLVEDTSGRDTLDATGAAAAAQIDLSGATATVVAGREIRFGEGGQTTVPLDLAFLQDLSGSFGDDIANVRALAPQIVTAVQAVQADAAFAVASFVDKAIGGFGSGSDYVYRTDLSLTPSADAIAEAYASLVILSGGDTPESSLEGLFQLSLREAEIGFRGDSARFVVLFTDAPPHLAGDGAGIGLPPNDGDADLDGSPPGTGEDYPSVAQLRNALLLAGITPIFAVTSGNETTYQNLVAQLGFGTTVTLSSDSSNVVAAITAGLAATTATSIEDAIGTAYNDAITGSDFGNLLRGANGNDTIFGLDGADTVQGGAGNDSLDGGAGRDLASYADQSAAVTVSLALQGTGQVTGAGTDLLRNFEDLEGGGRADTLTGNSFANILIGGGGNDTLDGAAGDDTLLGGVGRDTLVGGDGFDIASYANLTVAVRASLAAPGTNTGEAAGDTYSSIEGLEGGSGNDSLTGDDGANSLRGGLGDDTLGGGLGADSLLGGNGNDKLAGGADSDSLEGGEGADTLDGGDAVDLLRGGSGDDTLVVGVGDALFGESGSDLADFSAITTSLTINLNAVTQTLPGGFVYLYDVEGARGGRGADSITGSFVANRLEGGVGADTITGGGGRDALTGGGGADRFVYLSTSDSTPGLAGRDLITDFSSAEGDEIDVSAIDANGSATGNGTFVVSDGDFTGIAGEISIVSFAAYQVARFDTSGDGVEEFSIAIASATPLTAGDFIL